MKLFRNAEFVRVVVLYCLVGAGASAAAFFLDSRFGLLMIAVWAVFLLLYVWSSRDRYQKIAGMADDIDKLLHGEAWVPMDQYKEGELAILQSEVYKMTVRLREQSERLLEDKIYLADSLADISHQIRTPLTSINLLVSLLADPDISEDRRKKAAHELYGLLSRIDWLITTLLKISRLDAGTVQFKAETISFAELIRKAAAPLQIPMELRGQSLNLNTEGNFVGDSAWTGEAITNIVKNCMEHTPDGGTIEICTVENPLYSEIVITDNGVGISPADLPHIFERFYKGKDSDKNSFGIGLALARMIITSQNGTVKAENRTHGGAKFTIRFFKGTV